jgi:hypothetical protein
MLTRECHVTTSNVTSSFSERELREILISRGSSIESEGLPVLDENCENTRQIRELSHTTSTCVPYVIAIYTGSLGQYRRGVKQ